MIEYVHGNLLEAHVEALVNTVNTVGIMGKGIALQFRQAVPDNYDFYRKACERGDVEIGRMLVFPIGKLTNPRYIINFPTKRHWKTKSRIEDIEAGLHDLIEVVKTKEISSIAIPPLGCGNGGLDWDDVRPRIEAAFAEIPNVHVQLFAPEGAPAAEEMRVATKRPSMTAGRAAIIGLMEQYAVPGYRLTLLEIQKLAYFLQAIGEPLKLDFSKGPYGPYTEVLHHVLQRIEGHFIRGYGDRSRGVSIRLLPGADQEVEEFLQEYPEVRQRLQRVAELIEGFETPYGLELLATVHWLANEDPKVAQDPEAAIKGVKSWSKRKNETFRPEHIRVAWSRLQQEGWLKDSQDTSVPA